MGWDGVGVEGWGVRGEHLLIVSNDMMTSFGINNLDTLGIRCVSVYRPGCVSK